MSPENPSHGMAVRFPGSLLPLGLVETEVVSLVETEVVSLVETEVVSLSGY